MQIAVEKTTELGRKMTVTLPNELIQGKMDVRFKSLAREVKIDGFRPGKVPVRVVKKMYSQRVKEEVTSDLIQSSYMDALKQEELTPAGYPHIVSANKEDSFEYTAEFELYPEISLDGIDGIAVNRPIATVEASDEEAMIAKLREQKITWNTVERASEAGDTVTISFSGVSEGENFTDGKVDNFEVQIGAGKMIPGFEDELIGLEVGASKSFDVTFPENYNSENLAGKAATFEIELTEVKASVLPELDEEFIKAYGIEEGSLEAFKIDVKANMEKELAQGLKNKLKTAVMDALYEKLNITLPNALIDQEVQSMMKPYEENAKKQGLAVEDLNLPTGEFEQQASRRVALGLILGEIIQQNKIELSDEQVRSAVEEMAVSYESPAEVIEYYYADEKRLDDVKQMVLEQQTVDWIIDRANVSDETVSFDDIMAKQEQ